MKLSEQFGSIALGEGATERDVHAFLKRYPYVLIHLFNKSWNLYKIFPEFRLASDFRADFVIISADSGSWHARFIELEGPHDSPYTRSGIPTQKLNWAIHQTNDWRDFTRTNKANLVHEFAKLIKPLGRPAQNNLMGRGVPADVEIEHPKTYIHFDYHVVIGNSRNFTEAQRNAHAHYSGLNGVVTYDRVYNTMCELELRCDTLERQKESLSNTGHRWHAP